MKVTIKDIAKEANLSVSAVSLVLNNRACRVSKENKELIKSIAKKYNYSANQIARSLVTKKTNTIGIILPDIENIYFSSLAKCLEENCRREGYALIITNSNDRYQDDLELVNMLTARGVDGLIIIVSNESYKDNKLMINTLNNLSTPYIMVDRTYQELSCDKVAFDNEEGSYIAVKHLLNNGHKKIGCVANTAFSNSGKARLSGYERAMKEYHGILRQDYIAEGDYRIDSGYKACEKLLKTDITAVFICNDMMSLGFLKKLYEVGKTVPDDYSLVSYDNTLAPYLIGIELTSVEQNVTRLGIQTFKLLLERINKIQETPKDILLMPQLILKNSVHSNGF